MSVSGVSATVFRFSEHAREPTRVINGVLPGSNHGSNGFLSRDVNKQDGRIWGSENPKMIIEKPLYPQHVTVWCGFWAGGIIGPYIFEN